jgi:hypothetical protein
MPMRPANAEIKNAVDKVDVLDTYVHPAHIVH